MATRVSVAAGLALPVRCARWYNPRHVFLGNAMWTKRILILLPVVVGVFLLQ